MILTAIKMTALGSAAGLATLSEIDPIGMGEKIGCMTPAQILGVVCVSCVIGLVASVRAKDKTMEKLYKLIEESTQASQKNAGAIDHMSGIMVEVKDAMKEMGRKK